MYKDNYTIFKNGKSIMEKQPLNRAVELMDSMLCKQGEDKRQYIIYFNRISNKEFYQTAKNAYDLKRILAELKSKPQYSKIRVMNNRPKYAEKR